MQVGLGTFVVGAALRQVVRAQDDVLVRGDHRAPVGGAEDVVRRHHQVLRLSDGTAEQRHVHRHLVTVEVRVERLADERVDLDRLALDEHGHERLDAESWRVGARLRSTGCSLITPSSTSHTSGRTRSTMRLALLMFCVLFCETSSRMTNGLKSSSAIFFGRPHSLQLQLGADNDDRTAAVVDALAEQVLTEPALLALEHVGERLELAVAGARDGAAATAVVDERIDRFLQHPLLVAHDDLRRAELEESLQAVVAVDHAPVEVVEVGRRETTAVELHHRTQLRRDDRQDVEDHPRG